MCEDRMKQDFKDESNKKKIEEIEDTLCEDENCDRCKPIRGIIKRTRNATIEEKVSEINKVFSDWMDDVNSPFIEIVHKTDKFIVEEGKDFTKKKLNRAEVRRGQMDYLRQKVINELKKGGDLDG